MWLMINVDAELECKDFEKVVNVRDKIPDLRITCKD